MRGATEGEFALSQRGTEAAPATWGHRRGHHVRRQDTLTQPRCGMGKPPRASHFLSLFTSYPSEEKVIHCENVALGGQMEAK